MRINYACTKLIWTNIVQKTFNKILQFAIQSVIFFFLELVYRLSRESFLVKKIIKQIMLQQSFDNFCNDRALNVYK